MPAVKVPKADLWRAIRAKCADCRYFYLYDCESTACPLYFVLRQAGLEPNFWWKLPTAEWKAAYQEILREKRTACDKYDKKHGIRTSTRKKVKVVIVGRSPKRRKRKKVKVIVK